MKILLVRLSSMGDLIHTLPALTDLAQHRPEVALDWLCEAAFSDIARMHPFVKRVHEMRGRAWRKQWFQAATYREMRELYARLRAQKYQKVLDSQGLIKSAAFGRWAGTPISGLDKHSAREPIAACFYRHTFPVPKGKDAVWRNRQLFAQVFDYSINTPPNFGIQAQSSGSLKGVRLTQPYAIALHATSKDSKLWRTEYWRKILTLLYEKHGMQTYLPWGNAQERARAQQIAENLPFVLVCEPLNLFELADLLGGARAVLGLDTGLLHLANALDRTLVGIYTGSDPNKAGVQGSPWASHLGGVGQMPTVAAVYQTLLENAQRSSQPLS